MAGHRLQLKGKRINKLLVLGRDGQQYRSRQTTEETAQGSIIMAKRTEITAMEVTKEILLDKKLELLNQLAVLALKDKIDNDKQFKLMESCHKRLNAIERWLGEANG